MYSLVIAEDEQIMRNGLTRMVNWKELGFSVAAVFSDGSEVLDYLKENMPDVLLMDIEMIRVTGLEVAKFVAENKLPVKVILLTGYKNFEYARQAVEYNVAHYLLKPISLPALRKVFSDLCAELEDRNVYEDALQCRIDRMNRLVNFEIQQIILEIWMGKLKNADEIRQRLELTDISGSGMNRSGILFTFFIEQDEAMKHFLAEFGSQELAEQLNHLFETFDERLDFYPIENGTQWISGFFWEKPNSDCVAGYRSGSLDFGGQFQSLVHIMTGLTIRPEQIAFPENITDIVQLWPLSRTQGRDLLQDAEYYHHLHEQKKLLLTYVNQGDQEAAEDLLEVFLSQCGLSGFQTAQSQLVHFLSTAAEKLGDNNPACVSKLLCEINVIETSLCKNEIELISWGKKQIAILIRFIQNHGKLTTGNESIIDKLKAFIQENYAHDISLSEAAERVYLNPIYISRIFKEKTGQTFTEYLSNVRIEAAVELLKHSDLYVYEICERVGYHNLKYFYKIFRKMTGLSPSEYRSAPSSLESGDPFGGMEE